MRWGVREQRLREALVEIGARLYARGLVSANDGNLSVRVDAERFLITPRGRSKGHLRPEDLVVIDPEGRVVRPGRGGAMPSSDGRCTWKPTGSAPTSGLSFTPIPPSPSLSPWLG